MNVCLRASARYLALVSFLATMLALPTQARAAEHQLFIFVMNQYGLPVEDLGADEVIIESRGDQCTVRSVRPETDPMTVALIVDNSEPATRSLNSLRAGLKAFLGALPEQHKVGLFTISGQTTQVMEFTTDRQALIAHADNLFADQGTGAVLLDGLVETWNRRFDDDVAWPVFVTIVYDGAEASRSVREQQFNDFVNELRARAATVHAVLMSTRGGGIQTDASINITRNTGGTYRALAAATALPDVLGELADAMGAHYDEIKARYRVVFECEDDNPTRLRAKVDRPAVAVRVFADRRMEP